MNTYLIVPVLCLVAVVYAQDNEDRASGNAQIRRTLEANSETLKEIDNKTNDISNSQKGIERKIMALSRDIDVIERLEDDLKELESKTDNNFQSTADSIRNLTASIRAAENRTDHAIANLSRGHQDIKMGLGKVDENQNRYERNLEELAKSVHLRLAGIDSLVKQSMLKELAALVQTSRKLEKSQIAIESKVVRLDELTALSAITASNVQELEKGLRSINSTTQHKLASIEQGVQQVGITAWQIDNKLGVLLSAQKNIERASIECKNCQQRPKKNYYPLDYWHQP